VSNLAKRTITGIIGASLMIGAILWNQYSFAGLFLFISIIAQLEFYSLATTEDVKPQKWIGLICGVAFYILIISLASSNLGIVLSAFGRIPLIMIPLFFVIFIIELYRRSPQPFANIGYTILGIIYIPFTLALLSLIATSSNDKGFHPQIIVHYFFILWASDIGAYFVGKKFGKTKLFERISPKKTWEGSIGGAVLAFIVAHFVSHHDKILTQVDWIVITSIIVVFGTFGDLVESIFKRSIQIKDSGTILPGHGGFLDRFDGLFISSPFVFTYLMAVYG
jgi:phosphatidate cytidylyltransferase